MRGRFEGKNAERLIDALKEQAFSCGDAAIAREFAAFGELVEFAQGQSLIVQEGTDNDIYFLISGVVAILVNGADIARRKAGQCVGEMAAIEPALPRSATVTAIERVVALKVSSQDFMQIGLGYSQIWLPLAQELARRLYQRNKTISPSNSAPKLFIISSSEALDVAHAIRTNLEHDVFSTVWDQGVFFAGGYPLEALERLVSESDFALAIAEPDDIVDSRGTRAPTLRDNVLFELGLFMGKLTRHRSILVHPKVPDLRLPSDLQGLTLMSYAVSADPLPARVAPVCDQVRLLVKRLGVRVFTPI